MRAALVRLLGLSFLALGVLGDYGTVMLPVAAALMVAPSLEEWSRPRTLKGSIDRAAAATRELGMALAPSEPRVRVLQRWHDRHLAATLRGADPAEAVREADAG